MHPNDDNFVIFISLHSALGALPQLQLSTLSPYYSILTPLHAGDTKQISRKHNVKLTRNGINLLGKQWFSKHSRHTDTSISDCHRSERSSRSDSCWCSELPPGERPPTSGHLARRTCETPPLELPPGGTWINDRCTEPPSGDDDGNDSRDSDTVNERQVDRRDGGATADSVDKRRDRRRPALLCRPCSVYLDLQHITKGVSTGTATHAVRARSNSIDIKVTTNNRMAHFQCYSSKTGLIHPLDVLYSAL